MIYNPKNDKPLCPGCFRRVCPYSRGNGMCRECYEIWREWDRTRLKALAAAVTELAWHGFGEVRIARILGISVAQVRGVFRRKLRDRAKDGEFARKRREPEWRNCANPECKKSFAVTYIRKGYGKYCSQHCRLEAKGANLKLIAKLAKQGYSKTQIAARTGLSRGHIDRHWSKLTKPAEGKMNYATFSTIGDLGNDPTYCG